MNDFKLLVAIPSLYNPANYGKYSVCLLSPGVSHPPVFTVDTTSQRSSTAFLAGKKIFPATKESYRVYIGISSLKDDIYAY